MTEVPTRGLTFYKLECVRELLHQLCADEDVPSSLTARLMAERGVTTDDVMRVCRVAEDALEAHRTAEMRAARTDSQDDPFEPVAASVPMAALVHSDVDPDVTARNREKALSALSSSLPPQEMP